MKKLLLMIFMVIIGCAIYSKGFDLTIGGSYRYGYHYSFNQLHGIHQMLTIPISFSYYTGPSNRISLGFRNKIGYGITFYSSKTQYTDYNNYYYLTVLYNKYNNNNFIPEHEIYENFSYIMKFGSESVKLIVGTGVSFKYSFINIPSGNIYLTYTDEEDPKMYFFTLTKGNYQHFGLGPSFDFSIEIIPNSKNFGIVVGIPFDFIIPVKLIDQILYYSTYDKDENEVTIHSEKASYFTSNFSFGLEITINFYTFKSKDK